MLIYHLNLLSYRDWNWNWCLLGIGIREKYGLIWVAYHLL
jgi:hypothetical protein